MKSDISSLDPGEAPSEDVLDAVIANDTGLPTSGVTAVRTLFREGATVPFIARYRKERTGGLDEVQIRTIQAAEKRVVDFYARRQSIIASLREQGALTPRLVEALAAATTKTEIEDIYLPHKRRKKTRADTARERGLQPLADAVVTEPMVPTGALIERLAPSEVEPEDALHGAGDILAERLSLDIELRQRLRTLMVRQGALSSKRRGQSKQKRSHDEDTYRDYFSWREPARKAPTHRILAMLRGSAEGHLSIAVQPPEEAAVREVEKRLHKSITGEKSCSDRRDLFHSIAVDTWRRLILPALEREALTALRERATRDAIHVFQQNLESILLAPPFGPRRVYAIDPGLRTGCKTVVLGAAGEVEEVGQIYPLPPRSDTDGAARTVREICERYDIEGIAVGNGTGGRETEAFIRDLTLHRTDGTAVVVVSVNESGASVYSASEYARKEFPEMDVQHRGAVSIGRRLQDPLSELVKIEPQSIGVGQYQHDIGESRLSEALSETVVSCVNRVGVDINTAGIALLSRVAGLNTKRAETIVSHRERVGLFKSREDIGDLPGIGPKTVEQATGFLRCYRSDNPLERTGIHPERFPLVAKICADTGYSPEEMLHRPEVIDTILPERYIDQESGIELGTVEDIIAELKLPGRDPRQSFAAPTFEPGIKTIEDVKVGAVLSGVVRNVVAFGAFVDIGVHRDGLVHVSNLSNTFVSDPSTVVAPGHVVRVKVVNVDRDRSRIDLSMKDVGIP